MEDIDFELNLKNSDKNQIFDQSKENENKSNVSMNLSAQDGILVDSKVQSIYNQKTNTSISDSEIWNELDLTKNQTSKQNNVPKINFNKLNKLYDFVLDIKKEIQELKDQLAFSTKTTSYLNSYQNKNSEIDKINDLENQSFVEDLNIIKDEINEN